MTVLSVLEDVCVNIALAVPTAVFSSTDREHVELASLSNSVARAIANTYDWQITKLLATFTGDGGTENFSLPSDYGRMLIKGNLWASSFPGAPLQHITDSDQWLGILVSGLTVATGQWTIYGGQIHIRPARALAETCKMFYITRNIIHPATGANKAEFTLDTDTFLMDEDVLGLGIIAAWKRMKGLPYAEDMEDFETALSEAIGRDKGSKILVVGEQRVRGAGDRILAFPASIVP